MEQDKTVLTIEYGNSGQVNQVALSELVTALTDFLDHFGTRTFVGTALFEIIETGTGLSRIQRLLNACGYPENSHGFFGELLAKLGRANGKEAIAINDVVLPHMLLMAIMEVILPGNRFVSIQTIDQLEKETNTKLAESDRNDMQAGS